MADAYGPPCSPGTRSPRSLASRRSSPLPLPRFFVRVCARAWTLLLGRGGRDYGLAFKAACCESETGQRDEWRATGKHRWRKKSREKKYPEFVGKGYKENKDHDLSDSSGSFGFFWGGGDYRTFLKEGDYYKVQILD